MPLVCTISAETCQDLLPWDAARDGRRTATSPFTIVRALSFMVTDSGVFSGGWSNWCLLLIMALTRAIVALALVRASANMAQVGTHLRLMP